MSVMEVSNLTKDFLSRLFSENKRFDGRKLDDLREVHIEYNISNKAEGSARVKLGKTEVLVGVKLAPGEPYPDSMDKGNLIVSGDLLPLASPRFELGPPGFDGIEMPRLIDRLIRGSEVIDLTKLVIKKDKLVWNVFIDIFPINDDGSLVDAAAIGAIAALRQTVVPELDKDDRIDYEKKSKQKLPLEENSPLGLTFFKLGDSIILQPTREEEEACDAKVTLGASEIKGEIMIHSCQKGWTTPFTQADLEKIMKILPKKYEELSKKVNKFIK